MASLVLHPRPRPRPSSTISTSPWMSAMTTSIISPPNRFQQRQLSRQKRRRRPTQEEQLQQQQPRHNNSSRPWRRRLCNGGNGRIRIPLSFLLLLGIIMIELVQGQTYDDDNKSSFKQQQIQNVQEQHVMNITIIPSESQINYWQVWLQGTGGIIDLSQLQIQTISDHSIPKGTTTSMVNLAVFRVREKCDRMDGCARDWSNLGVAGVGGDHDANGNNSGTVHWCCTETALQEGACSNDQSGQLILNPDLFQGDSYSVEIPHKGPLSRTSFFVNGGDDTNVLEGIFPQHQDGPYVIVIANCNSHGRSTLIEGPWTWTSEIVPPNACGTETTLTTHHATVNLRLEPQDNQVTYFQRHLPPQGMIDLTGLSIRNNDDVIPPQTIDSVINVAVLRVQDNDCSSAQECQSNNEDWSAYGIGAFRASDETYQFCCTNENIQQGLCEFKQSGGLIYNLDTTVQTSDCDFILAQARLVSVPRIGWIDVPLQEDGVMQPFAGGRYIILMANCNPRGRPMDVTGSISWNWYEDDTDNPVDGTMTPVTVSKVPYTPPPPMEPTSPSETTTNPPTVAPMSPPPPSVSSPTGPSAEEGGSSSSSSSSDPPKIRKHSMEKAMFLLFMASLCVLGLVLYAQNKFARWSSRIKSDSIQEAEGDGLTSSEAAEWVGTKAPRYNASSILGGGQQQPYRDTPIGFLDVLDTDGDDSFSGAIPPVTVKKSSHHSPWSEAPGAAEVQMEQMSAGPPRSAFPPQRMNVEDRSIKMAEADLC